MTESTESPLDRAIQRAGGVNKLAKVLGVTHPAVCEWRKLQRVPPRQAIAIERWTGGDIRATDFY